MPTTQQIVLLFAQAVEPGAELCISYLDEHEAATLSTAERRRTLQRAIKHVTIAAEDYAKDPHGRPDQASALIQKCDDSPAYVSPKPGPAHVCCGRARCLAEVSELPGASRQSKKAASRALSAVQKLLTPAGDTGEALSDGGWDDVPANAIADLR